MAAMKGKKAVAACVLLFRLVLVVTTGTVPLAAAANYGPSCMESVCFGFCDANCSLTCCLVDGSCCVGE